MEILYAICCGLDVHKESISIAVRNAAGKVVPESFIETKVSMIRQFIDGGAETYASPLTEEPGLLGCTTY